jgi:carbon starvation protein
MGGVFYPPLRRHGWLPGTVVGSLLVVAAWGYLIHSGSIATIWPMFGVANQLLATLALCVGTAVLIRAGKARYLWVTAVPMLFMMVTTLSAAWMLVRRYWASARSDPAQASVYQLDAVLVMIMAVLALLILGDSLRSWLRLAAARSQLRSSPR